MAIEFLYVLLSTVVRVKDINSYILHHITLRQSITQQHSNTKLKLFTQCTSFACRQDASSVLRTLKSG